MKAKSFVFYHYGDSDHISKSLIAGSWYELPLLQYIENHVPKGGIYIDVGAFIGTHTLFFAAFCASEVLAFEPNFESFNLLKKNIIANKQSLAANVYPFCLGVGSGQRGVFVADAKNKGNSKFLPKENGARLYSKKDISRMVEVCKVSLIKIDVEGMQNEVFNAFLPTMKRSRPWLAIECKPAQCEAYLQKLDNYKLVKWFGATPVALLKPLL